MSPIPCGFWDYIKKEALHSGWYVERGLAESYSLMEANLSQISRPKCLLLYKCKGVGEKCLERLARFKYYHKGGKYFWNLDNSNHTCSNAVHTPYHSPSPKSKDNSRLICNFGDMESSHFGTVQHGSSKVDLMLLKMYITGSSKLNSKVFAVQHQRIPFEYNYSAFENWCQTEKDDKATSQKACNWSTLQLRKDMRTHVREGHTLSHVHL